MLGPACSGTEDASAAMPPPAPLPAIEPAVLPDLPEEVLPAPARSVTEPTRVPSSAAGRRLAKDRPIVKPQSRAGIETNKKRAG